MKVVGIVPFSANSYQDSAAAKNIYAAVGRLLVQTKRFTLLEMEKWKFTQDEIRRQTEPAFLETNIIEKGKSLGAQILVLGAVKNAEVFYEEGDHVARIDYEMRFIDVETGKSIAAQAFSGDSRKMHATVSNSIKDLKPSVTRLLGINEGKTAEVSNVLLEKISKADSKGAEGKTINAIEKTLGSVNTWIRNTFGVYLTFLKVLDEDKRGGVESILIAGGENIAMKEGAKLKTVLVTEIATPNGPVRDEELVAQLEVVEVRPETSKCKVIKGGKRMSEERENKNMKIKFE
jgi:hypothetical protein